MVVVLNVACRLSLKIKLFVWLVLSNKILTWDNCQKWSPQGTNKCVSYKNDLEFEYHFFVSTLSHQGFRKNPFICYNFQVNGWHACRIGHRRKLYFPSLCYLALSYGGFSLQETIWYLKIYVRLLKW